MKRTGGEVTKFSSTGGSFFGYLGFSSRSDFAKFAYDIEFLSVYIQYRRFMAVGNAKSYLSALSWLYCSTQSDGSRIPGDEDNEPLIPETFDEAFAKYGQKDRKSELIGCLLYIADETFQRAASGYESWTRPLPEASEITRVYTTLKDSYKWTVPVSHQTKISFISNRDHPLPKGLQDDGVRHYNEHVCERWNRIWHCFQMMDYFKSPTKQDSLITKGNTKAAAPPPWWQAGHQLGAPQAIVARTQKAILTEAVAKFTGNKPIRDVKCELAMEQGQSDLEYHLDNSPYVAAANMLRTKHIVHSPSRFKSLDQWLSYLSVEMKFKELDVSFQAITMTLGGVNGPTDFGEQVISSEDVLWRLRDIERAFNDHSAQTAKFTCYLNPGQQPDEIPFTMPPSLGHFLQYDEQNEFGLPAFVQDPDSPEPQQPQNLQVSIDGEPQSITLSQPPQVSVPDFDSSEPQQPQNLQICSDGEPQSNTLSQPPQDTEVTGETSDPNLKDNREPIPAPVVVNTPARQTSSMATTVDLSNLTLGMFPRARYLDPLLAQGQANASFEDNKRSAGNSKGPTKVTHPNQISVESLKRLEIMGDGLRDSCKASLDRAGAHKFVHTKASNGLAQVITPRDVWELDQFGPGNTRRDRATFIKEEYDGYDVIDNPAMMIDWLQDVIRDVAPGLPATTRSAGDRSHLYGKYKEHFDGMEVVQKEDIENAMRLDREMEDDMNGSGESDDVSFNSFVQRCNF